MLTNIASIYNDLADDKDAPNVLRENSNQYHILRTIKNRFGPANEIGVFEMSEEGLVPVDNPSSLFLMAHDREVVGSAVFAGIEGSSPILMEVQALIAGTSRDYYGNPKKGSSWVGY
nr:unnamed protein product [Callosobruchus chinensis]